MDPQLFESLSSLPWQLQLVLGSGYCAYLVAYVGLRRNHRAADTIFASLAFGLAAVAVLFLADGLHWAARAGLAFLAPLAAAIAWRALLRLRLRKFMRWVGYSWADDTESAWDCLLENSTDHPTQLTVETDDGWSFHCSDVGKVRDLPFGPFILGGNGDVLMYADRSEAPGAEAADVPGAFTDDWGNMVTYLPQERVRRVAIRFTSSAAAEDSVVAEAGWAGSMLRRLRRRRAGMSAGRRRPSPM